ncbi:hypothetical protein TanjilG_32385 [Lupinus angustifolius]|nr:hypothetical protein TanjilG_32385 [Lupinus angustifolius]
MLDKLASRVAPYSKRVSIMGELISSDSDDSYGAWVQGHSCTLTVFLWIFIVTNNSNKDKRGLAVEFDLSAIEEWEGTQAIRSYCSSQAIRSYSSSQAIRSYLSVAIFIQYSSH